ncbi:MAG TPA: hypothetical protein VL989_00090 [Candidatus Sulfotelmatobacter sp.]|nr:hypothetical protein [Candidatus Sulfotelmatobacter sp.]
MPKFKKFLSLLLALILIVSLVGLAVSLNIKINFSNEAKISTWIDYDSSYKILINKVTDEADNLVGSEYQVGNIKKVIKKSAETAYPQTKYEQNIKLLLSANLNWLKGTTAKPEFNINLINVKNNFANSISNYFKSRIQNLPLCTDLQLAEINTPLATNCWPSSISPQTGADQIKNQIINSSIFLNTKYITPSNAVINSSVNNQPYYVQYSYVAKRYQQSQKYLPYEVVAIVVSIVLILALHPNRRKKFKLIGWSFLIAGLAVLASKWGIRGYNTKLNAYVAQNASTDEFKQPIDHFMKSAVLALNKSIVVNAAIYIAIGVIVLLVCYIYAISHRSKKSDSIT